MPYLQASIPVEERFAELLSDALMEQGALSVAIEDAGAGTETEEPIFGEPGMPQRLWRKSVLTVLFDEKDDVAKIVAAAVAELGYNQDFPFKIQSVVEQDWVRLTQAQFDPVKISDRLWITPTWHDVPDDGAIHLRLDPGLAFGTGSHPTTYLCLQWLETQLKSGQTVLDYGCGSGILAITALKLGAGQAVGVDIDKQAIQASKHNAQQNQVDAQFYLSDALPENQQFDVVVSNILANTLRMLGNMLAARTRVGGRIVLSGILADQVDELNQLYSQWFDMCVPVVAQGWACLSGTKRD